MVFIRSITNISWIFVYIILKSIAVLKYIRKRTLGTNALPDNIKNNNNLPLNTDFDIETISHGKYKFHLWVSYYHLNNDYRKNRMDYIFVYIHEVTY